MRTTVRRVLFTSVVLTVAACGGDSNNGPASDPLVGTWALSTMDGYSLPAQIAYTNTTVFTVNSASVLTKDDGAFSATYLGTLDTGTGNDVVAALVVEGTWAKQGPSYVFTGTGALNGVSVGPYNGAATLAGNMLIVDTDNPLVFDGSPVEHWLRD